MIVVTGAGGNVGKPLVDALVRAGAPVRALTRKPLDVPAGVAHVEADLTDPASLRTAFDGAGALFVLTSAEFMAGGDLGAVLDVAGRAGVERVVLLSSQGVGTQRHPAVLEDAVRGSGLGWTVLRPGNFDSNALNWAATVRAQRAVVAPFGDVALPAVDPRDIAEVAALALLEPGHTGAIYTLTGPEPISPREQAAAIGAALGDPVRFVEQHPAEARAQMLGFMPEPVVDATLGVLGTPSPAEQEVAPDVERLLGRAGATFAEWAARHAAAFR